MTNLPEAKKLTERIRKGAEEVWSLLGEAYDGRAWEPLGYKTFGLYLQTEFDLSRSQCYGLVNQSKVVKAIAAGTGLTEAEVARQISDRAATETGPQGAVEVVAKVVEAPVLERSATLREQIAARVAEAKETEDRFMGQPPLPEPEELPEPPGLPEVGEGLEAPEEEEWEEDRDPSPKEAGPVARARHFGPPEPRDEPAAGTFQRWASAR